MKLLKYMKKYMVVLPMSAMTLFVALPTGANAQIAVLEVIKAGIKKVIKAVDLKVQRLQNETIWLQNAQKVLENQLSKLKLTEIADWTEKQKELYSQYYDELWKIKSAIAYYKRIKDLTEKQVAIVDEYRWAWALFNKDKHFKPEELQYMETVYSGILDVSIKNLDQILLVINSFKTQMDYAIPASKIATLSSGEFVGIVADSPGDKIKQKMFHGEVQNDHEGIAKEEAGYRPLPIIQVVTEEDVRENYLKIKRDVQQLMERELKKIKERQPKRTKKKKNRDSIEREGKPKENERSFE